MAASSKQSKTLTRQEKDAVLDQLKVVIQSDELRPAGKPKSKAKKFPKPRKNK